MYRPKLVKKTPCGYCFEFWAVCYDHIVPVCHGGSNRKSNLYPSCKRCNSLLGGQLFSSLDEKRAYIRSILCKRKSALRSYPTFGSIPAFVPSVRNKYKNRKICLSESLNHDGKFVRVVRCVKCDRKFVTGVGASVCRGCTAHPSNHPSKSGW